MSSGCSLDFNMLCGASPKALCGVSDNAYKTLGQDSNWKSQDPNLDSFEVKAHVHELSRNTKNLFKMVPQL